MTYFAKINLIVFVIARRLAEGQVSLQQLSTGFIIEFAARNTATYDRPTPPRSRLRS